MKRWILAAFVLALGAVFGVRAGASSNDTENGTGRETVSLKDAVKRVVQDAEVDLLNKAGQAEPAASDSISAADQELLDQVLLAPDPYYYQGLGRRDPFSSLVPDTKDGKVETGLFGPGDLVVVGILWGDRDRFALVEAADGTSAILRVGDRFRNATVTSIQRDQVVLYVTNYGIGRTLTLPLTEGKASNDERGRDR